MSELSVGIFPVLMAQATSQLLLALLLVVVFLRFRRAYRHSYLHHWALSWLAFAVHLAGSAASQGSRSIDLREPLWPVLALALVAGYLQIAWLLLGAWELAREAEARRATVRWVVAGAAGMAGASVIAALAGQATPPLLSLRGIVAGVAFLAGAATIVLRSRRLTLGRGLAGLALVLYAADQLALAASFWQGGTRLQMLPLVLSFDVVAVATIGIALVVWLLEGERERLERAGALARRREQVQACVYAISEAARTVRDLPQLYRSIHESLQAVLPARNFYVAVQDRASGLVSFPYFADEHDPTPPARALGRGLTEYVLRSGRPLLATPEVIAELQARGEIVRAVCGRVDWLGAPLLARGEPIGVAAIQTHDPAVRLGPAERDLFVFVAEQIASAIEAKRSEEALRQSEERLRMAVEQLPAILWTTDTQLRFTTALGTGLRAFGLKPDEVAGRSIQEFVSVASSSLERHQDALAGTSASYEDEHSGRAYMVHLEPLRDAEGKVQGTIGIAQDLSEKRQADRALRESEARLRQVMDLVPHFIFAKDEEGRFLLANRAVAEAYGTTVEELVGRSDADYARSDAEVRHFREDDMEVIRSGRPKLIPEEPITDARGRVRYLQTTKIPFAFSGTDRAAILGVSIDITEHKAADEALLRAAKEESLSVLAGGIAHDFNNLLAAILGHASLALKQLSAASPARHHVEKAAAAVERASDLTRQMLAYSGRGHFVVRPTDLNALVRENLPLLQVAVPKNVRLEKRLDGKLPPVDADVGQIQQVLMNLVINAAEAIGERGGTVAVATDVREVGPADGALWRASGQPLAPGPYVALEVHDDGPGMEPETIERIFEPFFTTKAAGRGLGLAAVLGVVRGHRGALSVESAPGRGTVFRLLFAPGSAPAATAVAAGRADAPQRRLRVLLIDDEEIVREMVGEVLAHEGVEVVSAADGAEGVALFRERSREIDVVLLDLSMPGLSGEQTYVRLHQIDPAVCVILSSGYDHDEALRRFGEKGPAGFIQKPYRPQQLMSEIDRCLGRAASR
jgi:PAS domain S-box-containing protein